MKKLYTSFFLLAFLGISQLSFGQFYDGFTGTGNIGGNCTVVAATPDCASNGWYTHSGTVGTIDIIAGSLSYTGLQASTGDKVLITGLSTLTRDVNAAITITGNVAYYSALVNVIDATNLSSTGWDYFMSFGASGGNASISGLGGRLGVKSFNAGANYRLGICNTSTGTPTYTDCGVDLAFGTTYLVVVKYDKSASPTAAALWVNPTTLGGTEPAGSVTNNSGTGTFATFASICIRNGYVTANAGGTPNAHIDEIRVGETFASVTPMSTGINEVSNINKLSVFPIPATSTITISANELMSQIQIFDLQGRMVKEMNNINTNETQMDVNSLTNGVYNVVATSNNGNVFNSKLIK